ncbi:hypothetical protein JAAARDRAFT_36148 [Jaapia argillacea MUCL 33604]|uniref:Uncharacterized protein n=1 Tax=Jaapia argillacea MUCL 33604 TaxID=933084 RepID=A0A067PS48_9AGAM|nr:hypothetical protein JAAARDRAFT_36148 [Jaapia argillacea MUCL 33604]
MEDDDDVGLLAGLPIHTPRSKNQTTVLGPQESKWVNANGPSPQSLSGLAYPHGEINHRLSPF